MSTNLGTPVTNPGTPVWGTACGNVAGATACGNVKGVAEVGNFCSLHEAITEAVAAITRNEAITLGKDISTPDDLTFHSSSLRRYEASVEPGTASRAEVVRSADRRLASRNSLV
jgi:hypothetical protein